MLAVPVSYVRYADNVVALGSAGEDVVAARGALLATAGSLGLSLKFEDPLLLEGEASFAWLGFQVFRDRARPSSSALDVFACTLSDMANDCLRGRIGRRELIEAVAEYVRAWAGNFAVAGPGDWTRCADLWIESEVGRGLGIGRRRRPSERRLLLMVEGIPFVSDEVDRLVARRQGLMTARAAA